MRCGVNASFVSSPIFIPAPVLFAIPESIRGCDEVVGISGATLTWQCANARPIRMQNRSSTGAAYGPWLVGLGAALWGTESAWRIPLNELFDANVIVFWEHVLILIMFLPILISH